MERLPVDRVRAGQESASTLAVGNDGARRTSLLVRDAWQPTAGARGTGTGSGSAPATAPS